MTENLRVPYSGSVETKLAFMRDHGSSVLLNYGGDTGMWECSWVTGGERVTAVAVDMALAVHRALQGGTDA